MGGDIKSSSIRYFGLRWSIHFGYLAGSVSLSNSTHRTNLPARLCKATVKRLKIRRSFWKVLGN